MGVHNSTKKGGKLLGGTPDEDLQCIETLFQGEKTSSDATSVSEHHQDDAEVKAAAHPETFEAHGTGLNQIALVYLNNPLPRSRLNTKVVTILVGIQKMVGSSGKTLTWPEMEEVVGT